MTFGRGDEEGTFHFPVRLYHKLGSSASTGGNHDDDRATSNPGTSTTLLSQGVIAGRIVQFGIRASAKIFRAAAEDLLF